MKGLLREYKEITGELYMHKSQADKIGLGQVVRRRQDFVEKYHEAKRILAQSEYAGIDYNCIVWQYAKDLFRFDQSNDFDTNSEPGIDFSVTVDLGTGNVFETKKTSAVWHGKEMWVDDDYSGFDLEKAKAWRGKYKGELKRRATIGPNGKPKVQLPVGGSRGAWLNHLMDLGLIDDYMAENGIDDPIAYFETMPSSGKYTPQKLIAKYKEIKGAMNENRINEIVRRAIKEALDVDQEFKSKNTDVNWRRGNKATGFEHFGKAGKFAKGATNLDIGGGRSDLAHEYLSSEFGAINLVFDPFNRSSDYNSATIAKIEELGGADTVTCFNCLNVIKEPEVRDNIILQCAQAQKPGGFAFFQVYEGKKDGPRDTKQNRWQEFRATETYVEEIKAHFANVTIETDGGKKYIVASDPIETEAQSQWRVDAEGNDWRTLNLKR